MSVLVLAESPSGKVKKQSLESVTYAVKLAQAMGTDCIALTIGTADNAGDIAMYGVSRVLNIAGIHALDSQQYTAAITAVATSVGATVVICSHTSTGKTVAARVAIKLNAGIVSGVTALPTLDNGFQVRKNVFSGKAGVTYTISSDVKVLTVMGNTLQPVAVSTTPGTVEEFAFSAASSRIRVKATKTTEGIVPLPEAELVVSAGRGMKGPENWGIIEDLAKVLGATTACSRPVADIGWRPHHEHVGQTGIAIRPNLYIAVGISGAIQHLAGVNQSKCIVVINKDAEAPFFKAADYGIVGDLFEVVPKLTAALAAHKASR